MTLSSCTSGRDSSRKLSMKMDKEVLEAFQLFDKDNDGLITKKEIVALITGLGGEADCPYLQDLIKASDKTVNKSLNVSEFMSLWKEFKSKVLTEGDETEEEIKTAFREYDRNGDGYITKDEMIQAMTKMGFVSNKEEEARKCIEEMDLDGDGRVSYAEFMVRWRVA